ncbi:hypothetical protein PIB30_090012 [Stylosanthes scabra]|uniref:Uncharacterized protein n=1 Tax=Stylosanthes scabra TaxID=79078 RepID=A0ABU6WU78_9FABA|nr:hypothetical protein [Stylosanthes scabra]
MANEQMLFPYRNTTRQFKEMEMQGIPVTMANLAIHRQREEEINQERMRYERILQEVAAQQAREANKGKSREVVPNSEYEFVSTIAWSFSPRGIDTPLHCGILLGTIRYTCRDLRVAKSEHQVFGAIAED